MIGSRIGPYSIVSELGSGGMGKVYLAEVEGNAPGLGDGTRVALKVIHPHLLETPGFFKRFLREAEIGKSVEQANVVRCFDCDQLVVDGAHQNFLVMEYVEGQTLRDLLQELERVPEELCRHIGREIAKGLVAIHEAGVIHRDLKPENVLITEDHVVKVMDLGVARLQDEVVRLSQTGAFVGSLEYACPEQFRAGGEEVDERSDLHALGVMLYELSTGQHPYRTDDTSTTLRNVIEGTARRAGDVNPQLSAFFEEVIHTLAAKGPDGRFASASTLLSVLEEGEKSEWWKERAKALRIQTKRPLRRIRIPRETALYGRDDDLGWMRKAYDSAKGGDGQVLLIEGEAGIGKTRLVDEFVGRLRQEGEDINFLFGSYPPGGAATAAGAFSTAYREQFGAEGLEETLKDYLKPTPILIPAFAAILKGETTPKDAEPLTKDSLQTVFVHATRGLAAERTTVVLIDDLHFAPEDGRALFTSLALAVPEHRILLIGTMRPGLPEEWMAGVTRLEHADQRSLSRLGPKDLTRLLTDAFRSERLAEELAFRIAQKSDGNPFFAFEIIRGLREGQFIAQRPDGTWVTTRVIEDIQVPSSVLDLVNARVADLTEEERDLLDVAACCGFEFDPAVVGNVLGLARIPVLKRFGQIERRHRLVRSVGRGYVFDHHQVQEALYGSLNDQLREEYHAAIAEALEARAGATEKDPEDLDGALCVDLCEHFLEGAQGEKALRYLDAALDHLEAGYLNDQAIRLADRALGVEGLVRGAEQVRLLLRKSKRLDVLGRRDAEYATLTKALDLATETGSAELLARVEVRLGAHLSLVSRYDEAQKILNSAIGHAREAEQPRLEADASGNLGVVFQDQARYEEAREHHERQVFLAREIGDRRGKRLATGNLGVVCVRQGRYEESRAHQERALALARELGDRRGEAYATGNLGTVFMYQGGHEEGRAHYERFLALAREVGDRRAEAIATGNLGNAFLVQGRYEQAREHYERHLALAREIDDRIGRAHATGNLGLVCFVQGRYEEARTQYEDRLASAQEIGDRQGEGHASGSLGDVFFALGSHEEARERYERQLAIAREIGNRLDECYALAHLGAAAHEDGEESTALDLAKDALALRREIKHEGGVADSLIQLGEIHRQAARTGEARKALDEAVGLLRQQNRKHELALALALLANLPDGDPAEAEEALEEAGDAGNTPQTRFYLWKATGKPEHLAEATRLLDYHVEHAPEEYRESMLKNVRLNREIMEAWEKHGGEIEAEGDE